MEKIAILVVNIGNLNLAEKDYLNHARVLRRLLEMDGFEIKICRNPEEAIDCQNLIFFSMDDEKIAVQTKERFPGKNIAVASGYMETISTRKGVTFLPKSHGVIRDFIRMNS